MNSKYAPIVALTALVIIVIAALGWFLAIKPRFASAADYSSQSEEVDQNTAEIQQATSRLAKYQQDLDALAPLDDTVDLNLPSVIDIPAYRDRITSAVESSKVALISTD